MPLAPGLYPWQDFVRIWQNSGWVSLQTSVLSISLCHQCLKCFPLWLPKFIFYSLTPEQPARKKSYSERHLFGRPKRNGLRVEVGGLEFLSRVGMGRGTRHLPRQKPGWSHKYHEETWVSEMWGRQPSLRGRPGQVHLLYLKWITNKNLPYGTGNSAQCYVTT